MSVLFDIVIPKKAEPGKDKSPNYIRLLSLSNPDLCPSLKYDKKRKTHCCTAGRPQFYTYPGFYDHDAIG